MKAHTILAAAAVAIATGACGSRAPVQIDPDAQPTVARWNATLETPSGLAGAIQLQGSGWMAAGTNGDTTRTQASVQISNASPGGRHPWHVHRGQCGNDLGILGAAAAYKPLEVGSNGRATSTATLDLPAPASGEYFINVHASPTNVGTIVACGNLAPPAR
jgi:hypothetical protein